MFVRQIRFEVDTEHAFLTLFAGSPHAFWLDSSRIGGTGRYSILGESDEARIVGFETLERWFAESACEIPDGLPPALACGYVGYLGYETDETSGGCWMAASRYVVVDHVEARSWAVSRDTGDWIDGALPRLREQRPREPLSLPDGVDPEPWLARGRDRYLRDIEECLAQLRAGESYEICLTNTVELPYQGDPLQTYLGLRRLEPAPYGSYLRFGERHVLSASPERFLSVQNIGGDRFAESRPIKGTLPRGSSAERDEALRKQLAADPKTQAENLMIVDLLRNDLGRVCVPGTIEVPDFLAVESSATVHNLVSTIRGRLRPDVTAIDAVRASFPPGSMTGAPKLRTMEIIDALEDRPRGVYSGALGWLGFAGTLDLAVVIRTAVVERGMMSVGAGGAIVLDSDPADEYAEMLLKAAVPLRALSPTRTRFEQRAP